MSAPRRVRRAPLASSAGRLRVLVLTIAVLFSLAATRAVQVQVVQADEMALEAATRMTVTKPLPAVRGSITGRDGQVLAFTESTINVIADPKMISTNGKEPEAMRARDFTKAEQAPREMAAIIARHVGGDAAVIEQKLANSSQRYTLLAKQVPASLFSGLIAELNAGHWVGVFRENNPRRVYPMGTTASNIVGFMSEGKGIGGLEYSFQEELAGVEGSEKYETSPNGKIPLGNQVLKPANDGVDIATTIDPDLQWMVEQRLAQQVREKSGNWGVALVMDVETGELLSMANYPSFDSNDPGAGQTEDMGNRAITASYEPGSVQKVLTLASLIDAGLATPDSTVSIGATVQVGDHEVSDAFSHGDITLTTRGVLVRSSNVGAITLARSLDKATFRNYLASFGLGVPAGLGLGGEASGSLPEATMPDYQRDSMAFGYGLSVTSVQMAAAVAAIANGGVYNTPSVIRSITDADGNEVEREAHEPRRVISQEASRATVEMMEQMVLHYSDRLSIDGYRTAAKTGTARLADGGGGYNGQVASIIGVAPVEDPQVLVYVLIARPDQEGAGLGMAGPVYRDVMSLALPRYGVRPSSEKMATELPLER